MSNDDHATFEALQWFDSPSESVRGCVLCAHGLNNPPSMFDALCLDLSKHGFHVLRIGLSGHIGPFSSFQKVSYLAWLEEIRTAVQTAQGRFPTLPKFAVGYSLGGALFTIIQNEGKTPTFERMMLLAPALALRGWSRSLLWCSQLLPSGLGMPSVTPKEFQRFPRTPVMAYRQLFYLQRATGQLRPSRLLARTPTRIYVSEHDEFMRLMDLQVWINSKSLANWELRRLNPLKRTTRGHLIASPKTIGDEKWTMLIRETSALFS